MIYLRPKEGTCNRLRAIASAIALARACGDELCVYWKDDKGLSGKFTSFFNSVGNFKLVEDVSVELDSMFSSDSEWVFKQQRVRDPAQIKEMVDKILNKPKDQDVFITTAFSFYGDNDYSWLSFSPRVINEARKYLDIFDENCIGVHVRRTDHVKSRAYSPISLFFDAMQKEIDMNQGVRFFLATDSEIDRHLLIARFGDRVITRNNVSERFSENGAFDGAVDLLLLSKTQKLYGSYWSSFSDVASRIGCIKRIVVSDSWQDPVLKIAELNDLISKLMLQTTQLSVKRR